MSASPPAHRQIPTWVVVVLILAVSTAVPAVCSWHRPTPPQSLGELAERIRAKHPEWHLFSVHRDKADIGFGFWATKEERCLPELVDLFHRPPSRWKGAVCCTVQEDPPPILDDGKHHLCVGRMIVFGDLEMLRAIAGDL